MRKFISIVMCFCLTAFLFSGCSSENKNEDISESASYENDGVSSGKYTEEEYSLVRNVFVDKYKSGVGEMQTLISKFDFSDECWGKYKKLKDEINSISSTFFGNEAMVSDKNLKDFNKVKEQVNKYSDIINKIGECREKSANEQAAIIAESIKSMNKINLNWKSKVEVTN